MSADLTILGVETSCDETAAAVIVNGCELKSSIVASQTDLHARFGGIIPEIASRAHVQTILPVVQAALDKAGCSRDDIDAVAVAHQPGLIGSLLVGLTFAKSFALARNIPLIGVNHLHAHIYASRLEHEFDFPAVALVVSGGHTALFHTRDPLTHDLMGSTIDDAAGEAFDKVASILGLGYPGGPAIDREARDGNPQAFRFPRTFIKDDHFKFSFSGVKTAVLYHCQGHSSGKTAIRDLSEQEIRDVSASFQEAVVDVLVTKVEKAAASVGAETIIAGGGVICNSRLRERLEALPFKVYIPAVKYCIDNAAMVAGLAYHTYERDGGGDLLLEASSRALRSPREVKGKSPVSN